MLQAQATKCENVKIFFADIKSEVCVGNCIQNTRDYVQSEGYPLWDSQDTWDCPGMNLMRVTD